jgi:hypothetical protein
MRRVRLIWLLAVSVALGVAGSVGADDASAASRATASVPPTPFLESVSPQGLGGLVSWSPDPSSAEVSSYSVQAIAAPGTKLPSGCSTVTVSVTAANSAAFVGGLCVGAAYVARVSAVNAIGQSSWSPNSNPFAPFPAQVPGAPLITSVYGRQQSLVVSWSPPASTGGATLSGYVIKASAGESTVSVSAGASATSATLSGLTDGTSYAVSVVAQNSVGPSLAASGSGVPAAAYAPGAPEQITAAPSGTSGEVDVSWQPPADNGGASVSGYQVTYEEVVQNESGQWVPAPEAKPVIVSAAATATSLAVSGLTPANAFWSFSVAAVNSAGVGTPGASGQPVSPLVSTSASAIVLSSATMTALSSDEGEQLTWPAPAPAQVSALKVGQVILAGPATAAPQGLLDTVESVTKQSSGGYVVGIAQAALSQAFTGLSIASAQNPLTSSSEPAATFHPALPGVRLIKHDLSVDFSRELVLGINYGAGPLKVVGQLAVTPSVGVDVALTTGFLDVPNGAKVTASASVTVKAELAASLQGSLSKKIGEIDGAPEDFQIGPVPVVVVPKIPIYLNASGQISTQVTASIKIGAQASWSSHQPGTLSVKNISTPLTVSGNPLQNLTATASVGFSEQPQLDLYDATGPNFEAAENLQGTLNPDPTAGQDYFSLVPSLNLKAGWDIDLLGFHADLEQQIAHLTFPSFVIAKPPGAFLTVSPASPSVPIGGSEQFKATRSDGQSFPVTWSVLGGAGDTISTSGLLQAVAPAGRTLTAGGTKNATIGIAFNNYGTVDASVGTSGGTLNIQTGNTAGASDTGKYIATTGGAIAFTGGDRVLGSTFGFTGPGQMQIAGGVVSVPGAVSIPNLDLSGSGELAGPGTVTIPAGGLLTLGTNAYLTGGITVLNNGSGTVQTGNAVYIEGGSTLKNAGTLQLADGSDIDYYSPDTGQLINAAGGKIVYAGGTEGASIDAPFDNYGTVSASVGTSGGTLRIYGGNTANASDSGIYSATAGGTIAFVASKRVLASTATLTGPGTIEVAGGTVTDSAIASGAALVLQAGTAVVTPKASGKLSSLIEDAGATLQFDVSGETPTAEPARLSLTGGAALGGTFSLQPAAGFVPGEGAVLYLLDWGSATGEFASVLVPTGFVNYVISTGSKALTATAIG